MIDITVITNVCVLIIPNCNKFTHAPSVFLSLLIRHSLLFTSTVSNERQWFSINLVPSISLSLDHQTGKSMYQLIWGPKHIYSRRLPCLSSVREYVPNPQETGSPREFIGLVGRVVGGGDILVELVGGNEVWDVELSEGGPGWGWGMDKIWSIKHKLERKL